MIEAVEDEIKDLLHHYPKGRRPQAKHLVQTITFLNQKFRGRIIMQTMNTGQFLTIDLTGIDKNGNPAPINSGTFVSSDSGVISVEQTGDLNAKIVGVAAGSATLTYSAKSQNGTQLGDQTETFTINAVIEEAVSVQATFSPPQNP